MKSLILICSQAFGLKKFEEIVAVLGHKGTYVEDGQRFMFGDEEKFVAFEDYNRPGDVCYEPGQLDIVPFTPRFFVIEYRSLAFIKPILLEVLRLENIWVDDDELLYSGKEYIRRLEELSP